jgi:GNAT superfamily N-acetyltransferase
MLSVRKAKREDAQAAWDIRKAAILHQCAGHYPMDDLKIWTAGALSQPFIDAVEKHFYVAIYDDQVVGTGMINLETGKIDAIFVHPGHMKMGVGRKVVEYLELLARDEGLKELHLESTLNAAPFYRTCGFSGDEPGTYQSPTGLCLDCVPMVKLLTPE